MLVYSYLQLHSTATEAEKAVWFMNNKTITALLALFAVEEQVKLFVAKQVYLFLLHLVAFRLVRSGVYLKEFMQAVCW